jgi:hypothetical protein
VRTYRPIKRNWQAPWEANFRFARQPPTIVTWAELYFYDLPTIRPSGFVNSAALHAIYPGKSQLMLVANIRFVAKSVTDIASLLRLIAEQRCVRVLMGRAHATVGMFRFPEILRKGKDFPTSMVCGCSLWQDGC